MTMRSDLEAVARGWRWTRRPLTPGSAEPPAAPARQFPTAWARTEAVRAVRALIHAAGLGPLTRFEVDISVHGREVLDALTPPVVFIGNHTSHLDTAVLLTSLPPSWRTRTAVAAASDYFFDVWWRGAGTALIFNGFPVERGGGRRSARLARELVGQGWNVVIYPEGARSDDGWVGTLRGGAAWLALEAGIPVVPIAFRGNFQAMPKGKGWPAPGRPPVAIRFGRPVSPMAGERPRSFGERIRLGLAVTMDEDRTCWWDAIRREARGETSTERGPEAARWRRVWEASRPLPRPGSGTVWR